MDATQTNSLEMARAVKNYLDQNATHWSSIVAFATAKTETDNLIALIEAEAQKQDNANVSIGKNVLQIKRTVAEKTDILNDALEAYALVTGNKELEAMADKSFSDIYRLRNEDFKATVLNQISLVEANLATLADFGVTDVLVNDLKADVDLFFDLNGLPQAYRIARRQATEELGDLFSLLNDTLARLDMVSKIFKRSNQAFYNGYVAARTVVDN